MVLRSKASVDSETILVVAGAVAVVAAAVPSVLRPILLVSLASAYLPKP